MALPSKADTRKTYIGICVKPDITETTLNGIGDIIFQENINESDLSNGHSITENLQETTINENHHVEAQESQVEEPSNGLENFGLQEEGSFELFDNTDEKQSSLEQDEKETEEDELEIPAFLRRQKN